MQWETIAAALLPSILLTQAATLLGRAREIDLSLDQQCLFVAIVQLCAMKFMAPQLALLLSCVMLAFLLSLRILFARKRQSDTMIVSIAGGLLLIGTSFGLAWGFGLSGLYPSYPEWISVPRFASFSLLVIILFFVVDALSAEVHRTLVPLGPPETAPSITRSIWFCAVPASVLTTIAATLLAVHAELVAPELSHSFGIMGATIALVAFGRLPRAGFLGAGLGIVYVSGLFAVGWTQSPALQSFGVPMLTLGLVALVALRVNRP